MQRRKFLQSLCIASVSLLPACKSTKTYYQAQINADKLNPTEFAPAELTTVELIVPKHLVAKHEAFLVSYNDDVISVSLIASVTATKNSTTNKERYRASLLKCTHMGCRVEKSTNGYICPCHGARFSDEGKVTKGPALKDLVSYPTRSDELNIYIQVPQ